MLQATPSAASITLLPNRQQQAHFQETRRSHRTPAKHPFFVPNVRPHLQPIKVPVEMHASSSDASADAEGGGGARDGMASRNKQCVYINSDASKSHYILLACLRVHHDRGKKC